MPYFRLTTKSVLATGVRPAYALSGFGSSASAISQFPKKGAGDISVTINGKPATVRLGDATKYAKSGKLEFNGYVRRERNSPDFTTLSPDRPTDAKGGLYWFSFESGFDPRDPKLKLAFDFVDETSPIANPIREPRNAKAEAARKAGFIRWAATKAGGILVGAFDPAKVDSDVAAAITARIPAIPEPAPEPAKTEETAKGD